MAVTEKEAQDESKQQEQGQEQEQAQGQGQDQDKQLQVQKQQQQKSGQKNGKQPQKQQQEQKDESDSDFQAPTMMQQEKHEKQKKQERSEKGLISARSRSSSRRARRQRIQKALEDGKYMKTGSLEALEEADANGDLDKMGMFERIGPDSTSMDGPVTHARAMRGEIPMRGSNPNQPYQMEPAKKSDLEDQDGLKLTLEANLDVEIELKASIRGDLTLSLYA